MFYVYDKSEDYPWPSVYFQLNLGRAQGNVYWTGETELSLKILIYTGRRITTMVRPLVKLAPVLDFTMQYFVHLFQILLEPPAVSLCKSQKIVQY